MSAFTMTKRTTESLWGDWLPEMVSWFMKPQHERTEFCPCCGLLVVPPWFKRADGEATKEG